MSHVHAGVRPLNQCSGSVFQAGSVTARPLEVVSLSAADLDLRLQSCHREGLDDFASGLGGNLLFLAEDIPHSCLCRWFDTSFDPAESRHCEDAVLLDLGASDLHEGCKNVGADLLLQLVLLRKRLGDLALSHLLSGP